MSQTPTIAPGWDLGKPDQLSTISTRTLTRLRQLAEQEYGANHTLGTVWNLHNGYVNVGTYVIGIATPEGETRYDLVVQYGSAYYPLRRNQPLSHLLSLDGFEVLVEYRERVLGVTITPTEEQMNAFLERYQQGIQQWIACLQTHSEMSHPRYLGDLEILEGVIALFSQDEKELHLRGSRYARDLLVNHIQFGRSSDRQATERLQHAHIKVRDRLYEWWKGACVDYTYPPAPLVDHTCSQMLPILEYKGDTHKKVMAFGQVAVVPVMYPYWSTTVSGFDLVDRISHRQIAVWLPTNPGGKAGAYTCAQRLSACTAWAQFDTLTRQQKFGLGVRVQELLQATIDEYAVQPGNSNDGQSNERQ